MTPRDPVEATATDQLDFIEAAADQLTHDAAGLMIWLRGVNSAEEAHSSAPSGDRVSERDNRSAQLSRDLYHASVALTRALRRLRAAEGSGREPAALGHSTGGHCAGIPRTTAEGEFVPCDDVPARPRTQH